MDTGPGQHHNPLVNPENTLVTSVTKVTLHTPVSHQKSPDTPGSLEGNTEGPGTASSEPLLPS